MDDIKFDPQQTEQIVTKLQRYFSTELDLELEQFDAEFLLQFIGKELGAYFYNKGLQDARAIFENRLETIDEDIYAAEKDVL
ncbi:MAG: DUF2164 domain-containing protein [Gammaproteobacteria bacterium]|nr:DUF2164 domain-containing protein [Gammaproteobacteria bacterium]